MSYSNDAVLPFSLHISVDSINDYGIEIVFVFLFFMLLILSFHFIFSTFFLRQEFVILSFYVFCSFRGPLVFGHDEVFVPNLFN